MVSPQLTMCFLSAGIQDARLDSDDPDQPEHAAANTHTMRAHTHTHTHTAGEICGVFSVQQERNINSLNALKIRIHLVHFIVFIYFFIGTDTK